VRARAGRLGSAALLLVALAGGGCRTLAPAALPPLAEDDPRPAAFLARLAELGAARSALRAQARVTIEGERRSGFARQLLLLERPARMRLEVVGPLGQRAIVLASDGVQYDLYRAERPKDIETGDVGPGILLEVAGLALTPEEAVQLALGAPLTPGEDAAVAGAQALPDGALRVELAAPARAPRRTLEFAPDGALLRYEVRDASGPVLLAAAYSDYRDVGGAAFAFGITLDLPAAKGHAEIQFQSVELNPQIPAQLFRLKPNPTAARPPGGPWSPSAS
jgi:outer membrane lipoprotein-sorting protein